MPRRKKTITTYEEEPPDERPVYEELPDPAEESYDAFRSKFAGEQGIQVKVYRQTKTQPQYCFVGGSEVDEESIRAYHASQPYANQEGVYQLHVMVNGVHRNMYPIAIAPQLATSGGLAVPGAQSDVVRLLMEQNARMERLLLEGRNQEREPINAIADAMLKISQLQQQSQPQMGVETILKCIELGKSLSGGEADWKSTLIETAKEFAPAINGLVASQLSGPQAQPNGKPQLQQLGETMTPEELTGQLKAAIAWLKGKCLGGSPADLYVEWICDNREIPLYGRLIHEILAKDFSAFVAIDAEIGNAPYRAFFESIHNGVRSAFGGDDSLDVDSSGPTGDAPNASANGKAGKGRRTG